MSKTFKALWATEEADGTFIQTITERNTDSLPEGEVLIRVHYSSLNYKDALSATGNRGVTREFPHTPGIDAAGIVEESTSGEFNPGDEVIVTGFDLGMNTSGGFGQYIRVPAGWVLPLPEKLTLRESMAYGTAGLTAALCVHYLQQHGITPERGPVAVTGSTGGVGSIAVGILGKLGYEVVAVTGKPEAAPLLKKLGAAAVVGREEVDDDSRKPLLRPAFAGAVDTAGGNILATLLKKMQYGGSISCCGLVASPKLETTVFPFILKGVSLQGVDSVNCAMDLRRDIWDKLSAAWRVDRLDELTESCSLEQLPDKVRQILAGKVTGRTVVNLLK